MNLYMHLAKSLHRSALSSVIVGLTFGLGAAAQVDKFYVGDAPAAACAEAAASGGIPDYGAMGACRDAVRDTALLRSDRAASLVNYGILQMRRGESAGALDLFDQAKRLSPRLPDIRVNVSAALIRAGEAEAAIDLLDDIASIDPDLRPVAHFNRGLAYWDLERFQNAYEDFSAAVSLQPNYTPAANMLQNFEIRTPAGPARQLASTPG